MTSPADMDKPAIVLTCLLGVLLIGLSGLLFYVTDEDPSDYTVAWAQVADGAADAPFAGENAEAVAEVTVTDRLVSNVTVTMPACSDTRPAAQVQPAATITWTLFAGTEQIGSGSAPCAQDMEVAKVPIAGHPDVGAVSANSLDAAVEKVWAEADNVTVTYRLEFSWDRPDGQVPGGLPVGNPTFAGRMGLSVQEWTAAVNEVAAEASR